MLVKVKAEALVLGRAQAEALVSARVHSLPEGRAEGVAGAGKLSWLQLRGSIPGCSHRRAVRHPGMSHLRHVAQLGLHARGQAHARALALQPLKHALQLNELVCKANGAWGFMGGR